MVKIKLIFFYSFVFMAWLLAASILAGLVFKVVLQKVEADFNQRVLQLHATIEHTAGDNEAILEGFSAFLSAIEYADRESASRYAGQILAHYPHVHRIEVVLSVKQNEINEFVRRQRATWFPQFTIKPVTFGVDPESRSAPIKQTVIHPIIFVEPNQSENLSLIGVDMSSSLFLWQALERSQQTESTIATIPFDLVDGVRGFALFRPVPNHRKNAETKLKQAFVVLEVNGDVIRKDVDFLTKDLDFLVYHAKFANDDPQGQLLRIQGPKPGNYEVQWLPKLVAEKTLNRPGQPYILHIEKQLTWSDINMPLIVTVACTSLLSLIFVLFFLSSYFKREQQRKETSERLLHMATHDPLTELPNRALLVDRFAQASIRAQRRRTSFTVMFIDLNDFKAVNDTYGHEIGDQLLKFLGSLLKECIRNEDTLCRISGDEFVILLEDTSFYNAEKIAEKIQDKTVTPAVIQGIRLKLGLSLGMATYPGDGTTMSELLKKADERMYAEKQLQKNGML